MLAVDATYQSPGRVSTAGLAIRIGGRRLGTLELTGRDGFVLVGGFTDGVLFEFTRDGRSRITGFAIQSREGWGVRNLRVVRQR